MVTVRRSISPPEIREAWIQYAEEIRKAEPGRYSEVEPWAWARLQERIAAYRKAKTLA
jgi:hypothetical protein